MNLLGLFSVKSKNSHFNQHLSLCFLKTCGDDVLKCSHLSVRLKINTSYVIKYIKCLSAPPRRPATHNLTRNQLTTWLRKKLLRPTIMVLVKHILLGVQSDQSYQFILHFHYPTLKEAALSALNFLCTRSKHMCLD